MTNQWSIRQKRNSQKLKKKRAGVKGAAALIQVALAVKVVDRPQVAQARKSSLQKNKKKFFLNRIVGANLLQARCQESMKRMKLWINQHRFPEVVNYLLKVKLSQWINKPPGAVEEEEAGRQEAAFKIWILCSNLLQALSSQLEAEGEEIKLVNRQNQLCQLRHLWKGEVDPEK